MDFVYQHMVFFLYPIDNEKRGLMKSVFTLLVGSLGLGGAFMGLVCPTEASGSHSPQTPQATRAKAFIKGLFQQVGRILDNKKLDESAKKAKVTQLAHQAFDIDHIAKWLLWPTWNTMDQAQRNRFKNVSLAYVSDFFFKFAPKYLNDLQIHRVKPLSRDKKGGSSVALEVQAQVTDSESGRHVNVRVHIVNGKIRNMLVENVNLLEAKKREYRDRLRKVQGADGKVNIDAFLNQLQDQLKSKTHHKSKA